MGGGKGYEHGFGSPGPATTVSVEGRSERSRTTDPSVDEDLGTQVAYNL